MLNWYDWHTVNERLQGRLYALTRGKPFRLRLDPKFPTGYCDLENKIVGINPLAFNDVFTADGLDGAELDEANFLMSRALTGHEALHTEYTDSQALREACHNPATKHLWNILEDARIEGIGAEQSHVSRLLFKLLRRSLVAEMPEFTDPDCTDPGSWFYLLMRWRCGLRIPEISDEARKLWRQVRTIAENSLYARDSWDVLTSAREIAKITGIGKRKPKSQTQKDMENVMNKASSGMNGSSRPKANPRQKPEPKPDDTDETNDDQQSQPDSDQNQQSGSSNSDSQPDDNSDDQSRGAGSDQDDTEAASDNDEDSVDPESDPSSQDSSGNRDDADGDDTTRSQDKGDDQSDGISSPDDIDDDDGDQSQPQAAVANPSDADDNDSDEDAGENPEDLKDLLKSVGDQVRDKLSDVVPQGNPQELLVAGARDGRKPAIVAAPYMDLLDKAMPIAQELERELKGEDPKAVQGPSRHAGRFKARYYVRDAEQPFAQVRYHGMKTPQMALTLILDRSVSMEANIDDLRIMAMAIYLVCEKLRIPLAIWVLEGQVHLKRFDEWGPHVLAKIAGIEANTYTTMMPTILDACAELVKRPEMLKQVILIHDGSPGDSQAVTDWSHQISDFGLFCMYIMPEQQYTEIYHPNRRRFDEVLSGLFGARRYAVAKVKDMSKFWCSHIRTKRKAYSVPV